MDKIKLYTTQSNLNLIVKTAGNACNLDCEYCFEKRKNVTCTPMPIHILENTIRAIPISCSIVMHGGEPLIVGHEKFQKYLDVFSKYYPKKINKIRIQTNGILLDKDWIDIIFNKNKHLDIEIAISLDGTMQMNSLRTDQNGNNSFARVINVFHLLSQCGIRAGLLSVISRQTLKNGGAKEYTDFISSIPNLAFVRTNALFNIINNQLTNDSITPSEYSNFIIELATYYIKANLYKRFALEPILSILQRLRGKPSHYCNYSKRKCFHYLSLYPDGSIGPCDCLPIKDFQINNIYSKELEKNILLTVNCCNSLKLKKLVQECENCDIYNFCLGGCLSHRYYFMNNKLLVQDFCNSKHDLYNACIKLIN